ncbi:MAG TPA: enolase [Candidatus Latescibacteria bacterium]|nr:enolase [Candidatus Latescibacterota bacterium]
MKITIKDVERITVHVPFTPRCKVWCAREQYQWDISEVVRVTTDVPDIVGYGETMLHYTWGKVTDESIARVTGANAMDFLGDDSLGAGLQMAIYDLVGKALEVPAYKLFHQPQIRQWCPISWWNVDMSPEDFAAEAAEAVSRGYTSHKIKGRPWWDIYAQIEAVRDATPDYYHLDIDWNQMLVNASRATPVLQRLDEYPIVDIYESPIPQGDVEGNRQLRSKISRPIAHHFGNPPFPTVVRDEVCDGFVVGGGVAGVLKQGIQAAAFDKPFFLQIVGTGITTALSLQLGSVLSHAQWPAVNCMNIYEEDLLATPLTVKGGYAQTPERPGLGIDVDEEALTRLRMEPPYEHPPLRLLLALVWPNNRRRYYANIHQCWTDALNGNMPIHEAGSRLEYVADDGSKDWDELQSRAAEQGPVFD